MSDREANITQSTLVLGGRSNYGSTEHGNVDGTAVLRFIEDDQEGHQGTAVPDVRVFVWHSVSKQIDSMYCITAKFI